MKRELLLYLFFFVVITYSSLAQENSNLDTLVFYNELTYHSDLEKEAIHEFFKDNQENYLKLFFAKQKDFSKDYYLEKTESLTFYIESLKKDKNFDKPNKKKVKYFYNKIHDKYLVKYELNTFFPQIFKTGYYNCVTGTILYGLIFKELGIPFDIKISPIHAYLVAYPKSESILVETTNPVKGYFIFNQSFKENYVKHLKDSKLISISEYNSSTIDELFDKHYFKEKNITLKEMVGIQYYNDGVEKMQNQNFEEAFYELEKAYLFYPSEEIGCLLYYTAALVIDRHDFSDLKYVDLLYKIARYKKYGITREQIVGEFGNITQNQLSYKGNYELYDSIYTKLYNKLEDKDTREEIAFIYNFEKARLFLRNNKTKEAQSYIETAYTLRPEHLDIQSMMIHCIANNFGYQNITENVLNEFIDYTDKYPNLKNQSFYNDMLCDAYIQLAVEAYDNNSIRVATKYQTLFDEKCNDKESYSFYNINVPKLYSAAAVYYFRKGNMNKSKNLILKGLKLVPDSYELKQRLRAFD